MSDIAKKVRQVMGDQVLFQRAAAYVLSGNPIHLWEAYRDCRKMGREPPPWVFAYFDESADRLLNDGPRTPAQIADALDLRAGGRSPAARLQKDRRDLSFLWSVSALEKRGGKSRDKIFEVIAPSLGLTVPAAKNLYHELIDKLR
jgi:hypothetical protein